LYTIDEYLPNIFCYQLHIMVTVTVRSYCVYTKNTGMLKMFVVVVKIMRT